MSDTPDKALCPLPRHWKNRAQLDRNKSADMQERMNRGEVVTVACNSGPYVDLREACADELESWLHSSGIAKLIEAVNLTLLHFKRSQASGNFQGDDEHECWTALSAAKRQFEEASREK